MNVSPEGLAFIARHEGFSSRAYRDPAGVPTIGYGFTLASRLFRDWWAKRGRKDLKAGDMIDRAEANTVLKTLADHEYGVAVLRRFGKLPQNQFDAVVSAVYNLGEQCLTWRWAAALAAGNVAEAARLLAMTGIRAGGRILPGLVRRRTEEAQLLQGATMASTATILCLSLTLKSCGASRCWHGLASSLALPTESKDRSHGRRCWHSRSSTLR
ncbi:lysozyme [Pannonibacter phragmitetus]|uniref:lysozyme n=1 Tax=Pannonibacter phragmitetus TaxID=121719 RepID=UPI003D2EEC5B